MVVDGGMRDYGVFWGKRVWIFWAGGKVVFLGSRVFNDSWDRFRSESNVGSDRFA